MASCDERLQALLEERKTWATKGVNIDGYEINADGKEEIIAVDICQHIGCVSYLSLYDIMTHSHFDT
jgi:Rieske Fe-S protein